MSHITTRVSRSPSRVLVLTATLFCLLSSLFSASHSFSDDRIDDRHKASSRNELIVEIGVREDAKPFSYRATDGASEEILTGFGGFTIDVCRHVLAQMKRLPEYSMLEFRATPTEASNRFRGLQTGGDLLMLCGPDSITEKRLAEYHVSHPVFESGMTYAYVNPRSPLFPRGNHCRNIVGVVRGTTADLHGLDDMAGRDILMRFDDALDLELSMTYQKLETADLAMRTLIENEVRNLESRMKKTTNLESRLNKTSSSEAREQYALHDVHFPLTEKDLDNLADLKRILSAADPNRIHHDVERLDRSLSNKLQSKLRAAYRHINSALARQITTRECPRGFDALPIRKYSNHNEGVAGLCSGEVLYYLGDYDIISSKVREFSNCDVVMSRFTRSKELYGIFFTKEPHYEIHPRVDDKNTPDTLSQSDCPCIDSREPGLEAPTDGSPSSDAEKCSGQLVRTDHTDVEHVTFRSTSTVDTPDNGCQQAVTIDVSHFYTTFNNLLLQSMQGRSSDIEAIFEEEFVEREKSEELSDFFETFKVSSFDE